MIHQPIPTPRPIACCRSQSPYQYSTPRSPYRRCAKDALSLLLLLGLSACGRPSFEAGPSAIPFAAAPLPSQALLELSQQVNSKVFWLVPPADPVTVTRYRLDNRCQDFVAEPIQVSQQNAIRDTVGRILSEQNFFAFDLSGYRLLLDPATGTATLDLRLDPESERLLVSLSSCEQLALFGSLRETLLRNPDWGIQAVTFTQRGSPIMF
ncbi:MAG TPA: hypothetical protein V6D06_19750 [Trichocoleus sp.]